MTDSIELGDHACLTFTDGEERLDLVAAFVRDGLRAGLKVVCWTDTHAPDGLAGELAFRSVRAGAALRRGQLQIAPVSSTLLADTTADATKMVEVLNAELDAAGRDGYRGLRVTADMGWATNPLAAADQLVGFESAVAELFSDGRLCLFCQYDRERFDAVTLAFASKAHPKTIAAQVYLEHPLLRICRQYSPPGLRIAGELDYRHRDFLGPGAGRVHALGPAHPHEPVGAGLHRRRLCRVDRGSGEAVALVAPDDGDLPACGGHRTGPRRREYRHPSAGKGR